VSKIRVLVIGCGKMGSAILDGVLKNNLIKKESLFIVEPNIEQKTSLEKKGIKVFNNLSEVNLSKLRINAILLAVKPQIAEVVLTNLNKIMINNVFIISIVAGKKINFFKKILGSNTSIIRAMPNTPASCGKGVTAIYPCRETNSSNINIAKSLFSSVGTVIILKAESKMDIVTAISGSGPAYVFLFIEELIKSAVDFGLDKKTATVLVTETLLGSSYLASISNQTPEALRENVTSPGGTTEAALKVLNKNNSFYKLLNSAVNAAMQKSIKLSS
jgi:pyrroline-5-carboxylate reductase